VIFEPTAIDGAFLIRIEPRSDERGFFARTFCVDEFEAAGIPATFVQQSLARSSRRGTLRGMHFQREPHGEDKFVRCVRGLIFDAIVDLRPDSRSFRTVVTIELDDRSGDALFVPRGCAHGYQTLVEDTDVLYAMSSRYAPQAARTVRWDDRAMAIPWPLPEPILSAGDRMAPGLEAVLAEVAAPC